jgi:signal transduction histidine kinase
VAGAVSFRTKILGIILALMVILGLGFNLRMRTTMASALREHLQEQSVTIARDVAARAADLVLTDDLFSLHELLQETIQIDRDVRYAFILDESGMVLAHTFDGGFPRGLVSANAWAEEARHVTSLLETDEGPVWDTAAAIFGGRAGTARVGLSEEGLRKTLSRATTQLALTTAVVALIGLILAGLLTWILTRPISTLVEAVNAVAKGDLSRTVRSWAKDEIGALAEAFNTMTAALSRANEARTERDRLRGQLLERVVSAQEEERKRIARELHDETSQTLTYLMVGLQGLREMCPGAETQNRVDEMRRMTAKTLNDIHDLAKALRPPVLDDLGLVPALQHYVLEYRKRYDLVVDFAARGLEDRRLPPGVETALYRIVQEGLTNAARHADPSTVSVLLEGRDGHVRSLIEDDGRGFESEGSLESTAHLGLHGIRERVELLGGAVTVESRVGVGTSICVDIPLGACGDGDLAGDSSTSGPREREKMDG